MPTFEVSLADGRRFQIEADREPTPFEIEQAVGASQPVQDAQLNALETSRAGSLLNAAAAGAARVLADVPGGLGYITGLEPLQRLGDTIETGINNALPINPIYAGDFETKAAGAVGQAASMLATAGGGGALARIAGGTVQTGAELAALSAGGLSGARQGGQTADELGITGLAKAAMVAGFGSAEILAEKMPFGLGTETAAARRLLGDTVEGGAMYFANDVFTNTLEEGVTQLAQNAITIGLAPAGSKAPGLIDGVGESMALGAVGGGVFGLINAVTPNPTTQSPASQPAPSVTPQAAPTPAPAVPTSPHVDVVSGVPFVFNGSQWGRMPDPSVENVTAPVVPLNPNDPVEGAMIVQLENRRKGRARQQQAASEAPAIGPSSQKSLFALALEESANARAVRLIDAKNPERSVIVALDPEDKGGWRATIFNGNEPVGHETFSTRENAVSWVFGDESTADGEWSVEKSVTSKTPIQPPSSEPAQAKQQPAKSAKDTLIDPTETDVITMLKGEIGRVGQVNDGPEWDWYRRLQTEAAASTLKPQSAEAAARRGEVDDPAALLAWVNANIVDDANGRKIDEAQNDLASLPHQTLDFADGLGSAILDAIDKRAKARQQGSVDDHMAKLEADTIAKEQQQDREFLTLAAKSAGTAMTGSVLSQQVAVGSTVRIDGNGTVQISSPTFGVQDLAADDVIPVEQVDGTPFPLGEATSDESQSWADRVIADSQSTPFIVFDPKLMAAYTIKGARLIKDGFTTFTKWAAEMVRRFGEAVRDYLQGAWQAARKTSKVGAINPSGRTGRAQPLTEPVLTTDGEKFMGELAVGDVLASTDGGESIVSAIYPQGEKRVYKITLADGRTVRATEEHLWHCRTNGREHTFRTWEVATLMQAGTVELPVAA